MPSARSARVPVDCFMAAQDRPRAATQAPAGRDFLRDFYAGSALQWPSMGAWRGWTGYAWALGLAAACTAVGVSITPRFVLVNIAMLYLLAVVVIAWKSSRGAAIFTSVLCVAAFDFFFVPPFGAFSVDDSQYLVTFAIMLAVALVIGNLAENVRREAEARARLAIEAETERIRSTLLASISHDLRTPL